MLYSDMYWLTLRYSFVFVSHVEVRFDISVIKELIDWLIDWAQKLASVGVKMVPRTRKPVAVRITE